MYREHIASQDTLKPINAKDRIRLTLESFRQSSTMGHNVFLNAATKVKTLFRESHRTPQAAWQSVGDLITVFGVDGDECRQATVPKNMESLYVSFASLQKGGCYSQGFTDTVGTETLYVPFQGDVKIKVFKKPDCDDIVQMYSKCNGCRNPACMMASGEPQTASPRQPAIQPGGIDTQLRAEPFPKTGTNII